MTPAFPGAAWWPQAQLGEGLEALSARCGLIHGEARAEPARPPHGAASHDEWLARAGARLGVEALPLALTAGEVEDFLGQGGPALIALDRDGAPGFVALAGRGGQAAVFLTPAGTLHAVPRHAAARVLLAPHAARIAPEAARVLASAGIAEARRDRVADAMVRERIADEPVAGVTMLRLPAGAPMHRQLRHAGVARRLCWIIGLFVTLYAGEVQGWQLIGGATLSGRMDPGWLAAWFLLLFTMLPLRLLGTWHEAIVALDVARLVKARLLAGALAMPIDLVRRSGVGELISRVMEADALDSLAMTGAFAMLVAAIELGFAAFVLGHGAAPRLHLAALTLFVLAIPLLAWAFNARVLAWTRARLAMTHYLIEAMVGHRTRLAQERPARRDAAEDAQLAGYHADALAMDDAALRLSTGIGRAWSLVALLAFAPALADGHPPSPAALAVSIGGVLLAQRALGGISGGIGSLVRAGFAWRQVAAMFRAGSHAAADHPALPSDALNGSAASGPVIEARGLRFAHGAADGRVLDGLVLDGADLAIMPGERVLLEGPSGGGKSTLAAVLTGLRTPQGGLLLQHGLDRATLGPDWHRRATAAPQFHENHVLSGTLAFNLLMGRQWPPAPADMDEAEALCRRLGLGALIDRMPGGLHQRVGETGWQLSHGERSRIFLARALLQKADLTILDESFGALDPETMALCLQATLDHTDALVVIAHP